MPVSQDKVRVVLADDHDGIHKRVLRLLPDEFEIVAAVNDGLRAVQAVSQFKPQVVILDIMMSGIDGVEAAREIKRLGLTSKVIFLTALEDDDYVQAARVIGASFVRKRRMHLDLIVAIKEMVAGRMFLSPSSSSLASPEIS